MRLRQKEVLKFYIFVNSVVAIFFVAGSIYDNLQVVRIAQSADLGGKMIEGGRITLIKKCVLDTPLPGLGPTCTASCPLLSPVLTIACSSQLTNTLACISASPDPATDCAQSIADTAACINCAGYYELDLGMSQKGNIFMGLPMTFLNFKGGGSFPQPGMQFIWLGSSNVSPYVMGIPRVASNGFGVLANGFNVIITKLIGLL